MAEAGAAVGVVEIGGSHVSAALVDPVRRTVGARVDRALDPHAGRDELLGAILATAVAAAGPRPPVRWAVAAPGPFDYQRGVCTIHGVAKLDALHGVDLRGALAGTLALPDPAATVFLNDAHAFALGEWWAGALAGTPRSVGITLGSGLGSAFLADGGIVASGPDVPPQGYLYPLRYRDRPLEVFVSRRALLAAAPPGTDVPELATAARGGDPAALAAFTTAGTALGAVLGPWLERFAAGALVVGGGIAGAWDLLEPAFRRAAPQPAALRIARSALGSDAPLLGAARRAVEPSTGGNVAT